MIRKTIYIYPEAWMYIIDSKDNTALTEQYIV